MNLNEYFEKELDKRIERAGALLNVIKRAGIELNALKDEISILENVLELRRNQQ